jgi:hypothetical protein
MYVCKSMTFPTPHVGHSRHGLFFTRPDCKFNAKPSEKDHDLLGIRAWDPWSSSQYTQTLHHLSRYITMDETWHGCFTKFQKPIDSQPSGLTAMNRIQSVERRNGQLARLWHQNSGMRVVLCSSITSKRARPSTASIK